jgi:hypothetical protein
MAEPCFAIAVSGHTVISRTRSRSVCRISQYFTVRLFFTGYSKQELLLFQLGKKEPNSDAVPKFYVEAIAPFR